MSLPALLDQRLRLPMVAAPMFLVSNPQLVLACCRSGIVGSFPALNQRESSGFEGWLEEIGAGLQALDNPAPYAVNLIVHNTNPRCRPTCGSASSTAYRSSSPASAQCAKW